MKMLTKLIATLPLLTSGLFGMANPALNGDRLAHVAGLQATSFSGVEAANSMGAAVRGPSGASVASSYSEYDSDSASDREYQGDVQMLSSSLAYVHDFSSFSLGASLGYLEHDLDFDNTNGAGGSLSTEADGFLFSVGGATDLGDFTLSLVGGWGQLETDALLRNSEGSNRTDYDTDFYFVAATAVYHWIEDTSYSVSPWLTLGFQSIRIDHFSEIDGATGTFGQTEYDDLEDEVPYVEVGLKVRYLGFDSVTPYASLSVWNDLGDDQVDFSSKAVDFLGTEPTFEVDREVADSVRTLLNYVIGCEVTLTDEIGVTAEATYFDGGEIEGYRLGLSGNYKF